MTLTTPADREFQVLRSGFIRDNVILASFRGGLRARVNPETGQPFTDEEIARATRPGTRWYVEAQATDDFGQQDQRNGLYLADQVRLDRATGKWLLDYHGGLWNVGLLPASGGSGPVVIKGTPGTIAVGSTTLGDPSAHTVRDPAGNLYQVFTTAVVGALGSVTTTFAAVSTGSGTNPRPGTVLTWVNRPPGILPTATVWAQFSGGTDQETEPELASRIANIIQFRPGAGTDPQRRAWARECTNAVEDGFVYPCAQHAGSSIVTVTQKRGSAVGPLARIPSPSTLATAIAYLTAPTSPVVPSLSFSLVTPPAPEPVDVVLRLSLQRAYAGGWRDAKPFPSYHSTTPNIYSVLSQTSFRMQCPGDATLPGVPALSTLSSPNAPKLMLWNDDDSHWVEVAVASIQDTGSNNYLVTLSADPGFALTIGTWVSPATSRSALIESTLTDYFDERGPGDFFDVDTDVRGARCRRFPDFTEYETDVGESVVTDVLDALQGAASGGLTTYLSQTTPSFQPAFQLGPHMLTLGRVAIFDL